MIDEIKGKWALITGASSGLGVDFARELATHGCKLVLVARREEQLKSVSEEIAAKYQVKVEIVSMDLGTEDAPEKLYKQVKESGKNIDVLVNNAGFGVYGKFLDIPWEKERSMIQLNVITLVHLTKLYAKDMAERGFGRILQVASVGGYLSIPSYANYGGSKCHVVSFSEALNYELKNTGVSCTVVSPGITATEFLKVSGQKMTTYQKMMIMQSEDVARIGIKAMLQKKSGVIPGWRNALTIWSTRFMPRELNTFTSWLTMKES